ncbi:MAG: hypothetical protein K2Y56_21680 [Methylobacterium sp.]|uniref:hypothetical protein n=1 Tax=Methylobacterium sp. TaxID=409 RepID=UPI0025E6D71A|nr:hypothetical protein [Methylobacterium sp.]MBX9934095.1 hypothetical protein [Methylobacterium sp.]
MVKRQTKRSSSRRRQSPVAAAIPETATPRDDARGPTAGPAPDQTLDTVEEALAEPVVSAISADLPADAEHVAEDLSHPFLSPEPRAAEHSLPPPSEIPLVVAQASRKPPSLVPADLAAASATLQVFLLNEGIAALAHWRALAAVRSPADAIRLHLDEMQRAADASLTCMGRIAGHFGRAAAA